MRIENQQQHPETNKMANKSKLSVITHPETLYETAHELADKAASTILGQYAIDKIDRILSTIEKTAKWSLPQSEQPTNADKAAHSPVLSRPLPWIPFLATIMALRAVRISLSFASILIGNEPISASSVVYFIQTRRRKLRYIKYNGLRNIREREQEAKRNQNRGLINKLNAMIGALLCRPGHQNQNQDVYIKIAYKKTKKTNKNKGKKKHKLNSKNKSEDDSSVAAGSENIPLELLEYLHNEGKNSDEDSDFTLDEKDSTLEECSSETTTTDSKDDEQIEEKIDKNEQEEIERNKKLLEQLIQKKHEELENEIKSKLESQIEERIALALCAKLDEKIDEFHGMQEEEEEEQQQQQHQLQQQQQQNINNNNNNNNNQFSENPSSVSINPLKLSPEIAQNGNIDDEKHENNNNNNNSSHPIINEYTFNKKESKDISSEYERVFENHSSSVQDVIKQNEELNSIESTLPFIENEIKTNLQINLKPSAAIRKNNSNNVQSSRIKTKK